MKTSPSSAVSKKTSLKIPRLTSLQHRLEHAKDADGNPIPLKDELLFFLDDPPAGTTDRWQAGADLCVKHGIETSRMSVWRFYRAHIFQWRREQLPAPPTAPVDPQEIARLHDQARLLAAQRVVEMLNDPNLSPGHLVAILQNENQREKLQLARDQFNERVEERRRQRHHNRHKDLCEELYYLHRVGVALESARRIPPSNATSPTPLPPAHP